MGGSSFAGIRMAVETAPPSIVAAGRLWVGALVLIAYTLATGRKMISLRSEDGKINPVWIYASVIGIVGYMIPMTLFPFAQQTVSSMLAGIYMASMPLVTIFLAATFAAEPLTARKLIGFLAGATGVVILIGYTALGNIFSESVLAQIALIVANVGYAIASVITRRAPDAPARSFAAAFLLAAAISSTPAALLDLPQTAGVSATSWLAIIYLGAIATGVTAILIVHIIRAAGAGFMAMGNYLTPFVAIAFGILLFGETLHGRYAVGLLVILTGLAVAQPQSLDAAVRWVRSKISSS